MSSSSSRVVPVFGSSETPVHYLTVREEDYPEIERWLAKYGFEYGRFFASYINYLIKAAQRRSSQAATKSGHEYAALSVFLDSMPVSASDFLRAMAGYAKKYEDGVTSGEVDLSNGRSGTKDDLEKAQRKLASFLYSGEERKEALARFPEFGWLFSAGNKQLKKAAKTLRRREKQATEGMGGMNLEDDDGEVE